MGIIKNMFYVYVLKSKRDNRLYIGSTSNLRLRLKEHKEGFVRSTRYRRPLEFIYCEVYKDERIARKREKQLKSGKAHIGLKERLLEKR